MRLARSAVLVGSLFLWVLPAALAGQGAQIEAVASVGRSDLGLGQQFILSVEVVGTQRLDGEPVLPDMSAFASILGSGTTTSMRSVNGRTTVSVILQYRLQARTIGTHEIGPITVAAYGATATTAPITINVAEQAPSETGARPPTSSPSTDGIGPDDLFITAEANRNRVLQNEPVIIEYRIYTRVNVSSYSVRELPAAPGFWVEEFELPAQPEVEPLVLNGERYVTALIRKVALFPTSPGTRTIEPMEIEATVRMQNRNSRDLFDRVLGADISAAAVSQPIEIEVLPLPTTGRPAGFSGMVGDLSVTTSIDRDSVAANEAVTMRVDVSGTGNLRQMAPPAFDLPPTIEAFPPETSERLRTTENGVTGTRSYEYVLIPRAPGTLTLPGIDVSYYDADADAYRVASAGPLELTVSGRATGAGLPGARARGEVEALRSDIRFIEIDTPRFERTDTSPFRSGLFWLVLLVPLGALGGAAGIRRRRDRLAGDVALSRSRRARRVARKRLTRARELAKGGGERAFYAETGQALEGFVADRLNVAAAGMIREEIRAALEARGAAASTIAEYLDCVDLCDRQRFSPVASGRSERVAFLDRVAEAMSALDREIGR